MIIKDEEDDGEEKQYSRGRILSKMMNQTKNGQDEKYLKEDEYQLKSSKHLKNSQIGRRTTIDGLFLNCYISRKYFLILFYLSKFL